MPETRASAKAESALLSKDEAKAATRLIGERAYRSGQVVQFDRRRVRIDELFASMKEKAADHEKGLATDFTDDESLLLLVIAERTGTSSDDKQLADKLRARKSDAKTVS